MLSSSVTNKWVSSEPDTELIRMKWSASPPLLRFESCRIIILKKCVWWMLTRRICYSGINLDWLRGTLCYMAQQQRAKLGWVGVGAHHGHEHDPPPFISSWPPGFQQVSRSLTEKQEVPHWLENHDRNKLGGGNSQMGIFYLLIDLEDWLYIPPTSHLGSQ